MRTFNCQQIAKILKTEPEVVFKRMTGRYVDPDGKPGNLLRPSIILTKPVLMQKVVNSGELLPGYTLNDLCPASDDLCSSYKYTVVEDKFSGIFGVEGFHLIWGEDGTANCTFGETNRACLYQGGNRYMVKDVFSIHKDDLVVTEADFISFLEITGSNASINDPNLEDKKILRMIVEQVAKRLYKDSGKFPTYKQVIEELNHVANCDDQTGAIIEKADLSGIYLTNEDVQKIKTIQNWLSQYKKTLPQVNNQSP